MECRCLKWAHMTHLDIWNTSYAQKLAIWLPTTKSRELIWFPCVQVACNISLKSSWQGLQLCFRLHLNWRSARKVMGPQSREGPNFGNFKGLPFGSPERKCNLDVDLVERQRVYYKGEGDGFPQVRVMVNLVNLSLPMVRLSTKNVSIM